MGSGGTVWREPELTGELVGEAEVGVITRRDVVVWSGHNTELTLIPARRANCSLSHSTRCKLIHVVLGSYVAFCSNE